MVNVIQWIQVLRKQIVLHLRTVLPARSPFGNSKSKAGERKKEKNQEKGRGKRNACKGGQDNFKTFYYVFPRNGLSAGL